MVWGLLTSYRSFILSLGDGEKLLLTYTNYITLYSDLPYQSLPRLQSIPLLQLRLYECYQVLEGVSPLDLYLPHFQLRRPPDRVERDLDSVIIIFDEICVCHRSLLFQSTFHDFNYNPRTCFINSLQT